MKTLAGMNKTQHYFVWGSMVLLTYFSIPTVANATIKIMPLGDSITYGIGSTSHNGYRKPLYQALTDAGYNFDFVGSEICGDFADIDHEGHCGWHADKAGPDDILGQVHNWLTANPADIVLLHIGTNDICYGEQSANEVGAILNEIDSFGTDIKVILALIINRANYNSTTTQFNADVYNMAQNRIAAGDDITIVDMENALNYKTDMADNLHPNNAGYSKMADVWFDVLISVPEPTTLLLLGLGMVVLKSN